MEPTPTALPLEYAAPSIRDRFTGLWSAAGMVPVFILLVIAASVFVKGFASAYNLQSLALSVVTVGLLSCTMMFCLAAGDFDLSIGSVVAMTSVLAAIVTQLSGSYVVGCLAAIAAGGIVGVFNGFVIAVVGINALITTLATMQIVRGLGFILNKGDSAFLASPAATLVGRSSLLGVSTPVWILIVAVVIFGVLLNFTTFGRNTLAIGGNPEASRLAGIRVAWNKILIFSFQGIMGGVAGVIIASRMGMADPKDQIGLELRVISACVLGGVSLTGGIATISGAIIGVLIMGTVQNIMDLLAIQSYWQYVVSGTILLLAVIFDKLKQR
jgi:L-arabinose transport system permease protein